MRGLGSFGGVMCRRSFQLYCRLLYEEYVCFPDDSDTEDTDITVDMDLERLETLTETDV